jgi:hypothetical protein
MAIRGKQWEFYLLYIKVEGEREEAPIPSGRGLGEIIILNSSGKKF